MSNTNFDRYLDEQLADPGFARKFRKADRDWEDRILAARREGLESKRSEPRRGKPSSQ